MTNSMLETAPGGLSTLLHLGKRAHACAKLADLGFTMANETLSLVEYRQALVFGVTPGGGLQLLTASGLASVAEDSPFVVWVKRFVRSLPTEPGCHQSSLSEASASCAEGWEEWLPAHLLTAPLTGPDGQPAGLMLYARETPWDDAEIDLLQQLHEIYGYCLWSLRKRSGFFRLPGKLLEGRAVKWLALALLLMICIPVRLNALAPAEVAPLNAMAVAAPLDGVIGNFFVTPNAPVKAGDALFSLVDSTLTNRREIARKALSIARADALVAEQRAFDDIKSKGQLAAALGQVKEKEAELAAADAMLNRVTIRAERDGIALFSDPNDWLGKPVQTGERVMQIADPNDAGVLVWLPVADALNLEKGAPVRMFLHTKPLSPLDAQLLQTSYQATLSPEGTASYRVRGEFAPGVSKPRIGLRGTARISGDWALLGYYLARRPIAAMREWTGL